MGILIRVDSLRETNQTETELNKLRQKYAYLVKSESLYLGFTYVINKKNLREVPGFLVWCQENNELVDLIVLIMMRPIILDKKDKFNEDELVYLRELLDIIYEKINIQPSAYLGNELLDLDIKWLYSFYFSLDNKILGYLDKKIIELMQAKYHFKFGKYFYILGKKNHYLSFFNLLYASFLNKSMRKILKNYLKEILKNPFKLKYKIHLQILDIVVPPGFVEGKRDICDSCPDATLYNGKLYPSCGLEEIKKYGKPYELKRVN